MHKFFSLRFIFGELSKVFLRFPLTLIYSFLIALLSDAVINKTSVLPEPILLKLILSCVLGLSSSVAVYLFFETKEETPTNTILKHAIALLIPVLLFISVYSIDDIWETQQTLKNFTYVFIAHLVVSFAAFLKQNYTDSFWEFNKSLFLRFITASIYSAAIFAGIAGALLACKELFGLNVTDRVFGSIFWWCAVFFQSCIFLAGVPAKNDLYNETITYPNPLKVFAQYILLPIALLYLGILYAYGAKILVQFSLPVGWVSSLILAYAIVGLFCFLLLYPVKDNDNNKWVKSTLKYFYLSIIPLLVLLFISIFYRISQYGITEERYYVMVLSLWLAGITFYGLFSKNINIKLIPISLALVHLLMVLGPLNGFTISRISQHNRLEKLFIKHKMYDGEKAIALKDTINIKEEQEMQSIISYLINNHNINDVNPFFGIDIAKIDALKNKEFRGRMKYTTIDSVYQILNLRNFDTPDPTIYFTAEGENTYNTNGSKYMIIRNNYPYDVGEKFSIEKQTLISYHDDPLDSLSVKYQNKVYVADTKKMKADLMDLSKQQPDGGSISLNNYAIPLTNGDGKITIYVKDIRLNKMSAKPQLEGINYYILVN
ncbi:MAG: DUF4153 domain-containing protein [Bacteroidota bacterium]